MRKYDTILFDLDGTIVESKPGIVKCIHDALVRYDVPHTSAQLDKMIGPPFQVSMREILGLSDPVLIENLIAVYRVEYGAGGWKDCSVYAGVEQLLSRLNDDGFCVCMATSKPLKFSEMMMEGLGLSKYFTFIGGTVSDSTPETKSDVINNVLSTLKITDKSRVLMVGDRLYDVVGAHTSGVKAAGILWGYGSREEFADCNADYVIETPDALYNFLTE